MTHMHFKAPHGVSPAPHTSHLPDKSRVQVQSSRVHPITSQRRPSHSTHIRNITIFCWSDSSSFIKTTQSSSTTAGQIFQHKPALAFVRKHTRRGWEHVVWAGVARPRMCSLLTAEQQDQTRTGQAAAASLPSCLPRLRPGRGAECWPGADLHTATVSLRPARAGRGEVCRQSARPLGVTQFWRLHFSHLRWVATSDTSSSRPW